MIDFEIPDETKLVRAQVREFVQSVCIPAEQNLNVDTFDGILAELRLKARAQGLWCPFFPIEWGGMGLKPLANALVQMELGESMLGALALNTQGPDDATMMTLLRHGTAYQHETFLKATC
jgi:acyl-CoA dehydrogenase